jgi:2,3-bisphosphoglycerate-dependent phosphoglycerate mutase
MPDRYPQRRFAPPPGTTEVVLVRHGASAAAVPDEPFDLLDGHADPPLAPEGHEQAAALAERLAEEGAAGLFVTPLRRTQETAAPLAERLGLEPVVVPDLREVMLGDWEGGRLRIHAAEGDPLFFRMLEAERWDVIPGAEPMDAFAERVRRGLETIVDTVGPDARAIAVVHGGVIGELCRQATASRPFAFVHSDNCSITRLAVLSPERWLVHRFNDTAHLDDSGH